MNEPFNYTLGSALTDQSPAVPESPGWDISSDGVIVGNLTYGSYATSGNALELNNGGAVDFFNQPATTTLYSSVLVQINAIGTYGGVYFGKVITGFDDRDNIGAAVQNGQFSASAADIADSVVVGDTYMFVTKYELTDIGGGSYTDTVTAWYGDNGATTLSQLGGSFTFTIHNASYLQDIEYSTDYDVTIDELRLGTDLSSVAPGMSFSAVPEPSFYALALGLAAAGFAFRLRHLRRRAGVLA